MSNHEITKLLREILAECKSGREGCARVALASIHDKVNAFADNFYMDLLEGEDKPNDDEDVCEQCGQHAPLFDTSLGGDSVRLCKECS